MSSRQALSTKMGSGESYMGSLSREQIADMAAGQAQSPATGPLNDGASTQALASHLDTSCFAKEQVPVSPPAVCSKYSWQTGSVCTCVSLLVPYRLQFRVKVVGIVCLPASVTVLLLCVLVGHISLQGCSIWVHGSITVA